MGAALSSWVGGLVCLWAEGQDTIWSKRPKTKWRKHNKDSPTKAKVQLSWSKTALFCRSCCFSKEQRLFLFPLRKHKRSWAAVMVALPSLQELRVRFVRGSVFRGLSKPSVPVLAHQDNHLLCVRLDLPRKGDREVKGAVASCRKHRGSACAPLALSLLPLTVDGGARCCPRCCVGFGPLVYWCKHSAVCSLRSCRKGFGSVLDNAGSFVVPCLIFILALLYSYFSSEQHI